MACTSLDLAKVQHLRIELGNMPRMKLPWPFEVLLRCPSSVSTAPIPPKPRVAATTSVKAMFCASFFNQRLQQDGKVTERILKG